MAAAASRQSDSASLPCCGISRSMEHFPNRSRRRVDVDRADLRHLRISLGSQRQRQGSPKENRKPRHERSGRVQQERGLGCDPIGLVRRTSAVCGVRWYIAGDIYRYCSCRFAPRAILSEPTAHDICRVSCFTAPGSPVPAVDSLDPPRVGGRLFGNHWETRALE